jgi:epoxyqueuosine reductase
VILPSQELRALALAAGFDHVGFARAEPLPPSLLLDWIAAGFHADMDWMATTMEKRLDVTGLLPGAKTVIALACNYWHSDAASPIARYARGRDYHSTLRERIRVLRRTFRERFSGIADYGTVDTNPMMEKVWAAKAGLGYVARNSCLVTPQYGSYVLLATFIVTAEVDAYSTNLIEDRCGACRLCLDACPTGAFVREKTVDARLCLSYQTIENETSIPDPIRAGLENIVFGCDVCQDICPLNQSPVVGGERFRPRPLGELGAKDFAAMTREQYQLWVPGTPLGRAGFDGLRRNAAYALGAARDASARDLLEGLSREAIPEVAEAARWALGRLT